MVGRVSGSPGIWKGAGAESVRDGHAHRGCALLVDAEVMRNCPRDQRGDRGAVLRELDNRAHHDLRFLGRRKSNEPAVIEAMRVLGGRRLAGDLEIGEARPARRSLLHDGNHGAPQRSPADPH